MHSIRQLTNEAQDDRLSEAKALLCFYNVHHWLNTFTLQGAPEKLIHEINVSLFGYKKNWQETYSALQMTRNIKETDV